jgi:hypothetical protein
MALGIFSRRDAGAVRPDVERLTVVGVRHHSPACARLVRETIDRQRPAFVLIEGPADFNPYVGEFKLAHELPVAIFSFHATAERRQASYSPFCATSPEWEALQSAWRVGAEPLFCDLPAWHPDFGERANRYADPHGRRAAAAEACLGKALGEDGRDALWDALAEQAAPDELVPRLDRYFDLLRPDGAEDPAEAARERFMAAYAAWALRQAGRASVVLVCGGWHAEAIRRHVAGADGSKPQVPEPAGEERAGSYLVPYDYQRLDRFTGYASGMPSPAYYEEVHEQDLGAAADWAETTIAAALRAAGQVVSTADRIAWRTHAAALAMTRGHRAILRADLLDAALATLVKDGLDRPSAWTQSGAVTAGTHPALVAMLRAMTGTRRGRLATGTRQPPLVADVAERLAAVDLAPGPAWRRVELDWAKPADRGRAHVLHALRLVGMPGLERLEGPSSAGTRAPVETFRIIAHRVAQGLLIEASRWGGTLPMAAAALLSDRAARAQGDLAAIAACLSDALFAGLLGIDDELTRQLESGIAGSHDIAAIGKGGLGAVRLYRFADVFGAAVHQRLGDICAGAFARVQWLIEAIENEAEGLRAIDAVLACRDILRECPDLAVDRAAFTTALGRCLANPDAAAALAGAALGCLIACGETDVSGASQRIRGYSPDRLGDFLSGLFALAREEIAAEHSIIAAVSRLVSDWAADEFLTALPAMRQAFAWFPPRERERLARAVLRTHGFGEAAAEIEALNWMRQTSRVTDQAAAMALEAAVAERLARAGLA